MNAVATVQARPSIEWQKPIINDPLDALEQALGKIERLRSLLRDNTDNMADHLIPAEGVPAYASTVWEIFVLAGEKLTEIDALVSSIIDSGLREAQSSVGRHVEIKRHLEWNEVLRKWRAIEAVPVTDETPDSVFDDAAAAFKAMVECPSPDLTTLHEKITVIQDGSGWQTDFVIPAIINDVQRLAQRYERSADLAVQVEG